MNKQTIIFLLAVFQIYLLSAQTELLPFYDGSFASLQAEAKVEDKPYFLAFVTAECEPCSKLATNTFNDPHLATYISEHYLAYQLRVDSYRGEEINLAQEYGVMFYPTIIIFDPEGKVLEKFTGFKMAGDFLTLLEKYANSNAQDIVYSPISVTSHNSSSFPPPIIKDENPVMQASLKFEPVPTSTATHNINPPISVEDASLFRISVSQQSAEGYGLQVGVYREYENVIKKVHRLEAQGHHQVLVNIGNLMGKPVFKIVVGPFSSKEAAQTYREKMQDKEDRKGIINELSKYK